MLKDYVALDIETTGLNPLSDCILEIGAVRVRDGEETGHYASFVNPGIPIPEAITQLTGIDDEMVKDARDVRQVLEEFLGFCEDSVILGHSVSFDFRFLAQNAERMGREFPSMAIDTLKIARKCLPDLPGRSLEALCRYYGIVQEKKHRAYEDARSAKLLYEHLCREFEIGNEQIFSPEKLSSRSKKEEPLTKSQKVYLKDLVKYHRIELNVDLDGLTKRQASRMIDRIILQYGRIVKR